MSDLRYVNQISRRYIAFSIFPLSFTTHRLSDWYINGTGSITMPIRCSTGKSGLMSDVSLFTRRAIRLLTRLGKPTDEEGDLVFDTNFGIQ